MFLNPSQQQRGWECRRRAPQLTQEIFQTIRCRAQCIKLGKEEGRENVWIDGVCLPKSPLQVTELCFPGMAEHLAGMDELLVLLCLSVWLWLYILSWAVFISAHKFSHRFFPFLILSPVALAGVSRMSFCLGLNHNSCSQLCKVCAEISAGLWNSVDTTTT